MATAGTASKYFLTFMIILLLKTYVVETQGFPETSRYTEKFSHEDDRPNHLRQKRETSISAIEYIVVVEVNISQAIMLEQLRSSLNSFSLQIMDSTNISAVGLTTVCQLYKTSFQCRCESQYAWPCDKCLSYGHCDDIVNSSCGCINAIPNDGLLCQPLNGMANATCPAPPQTTVILPTLPTTAPTTTLVILPTKPPLPPTVPPTTPQETTLSLSLTLDEKFDVALTNPTSDKYIRYKTNIQKAIDNGYKNMVGYVPGSVTIFRFRHGSVIADFIINTTKNELDFASVNTQLTSKLNDIGFKVAENAFSQSDEYNLLQNSGKIYPLQDMVLNCGLPAADIKWRVNVPSEIDPSSKPEKYIILNNNRTLKVKSMSALDNGKYECITGNNSLKSIQWQDITIQPLPNIMVDSNKMLKCGDFSIPLQCCAQSSYTIEWSQNSLPSPLTPPGQGLGCITYNYAVQKLDCESNDKIVTFTCQLSDVNLRVLSYGSKNITITTTKKALDCTDKSFGIGTINQVASKQCDGDQVGTQWAVCTSTGWIVTKQDCTLRAIQELTDKVEILNVQDVPQFVANLSDVAKNNSAMVTQANFTLLKVVDLLSTVTSVLIEKSFTVDKTVMTHFLKTVDIITSKDAQTTWQSLNKGNSSQNASSALLQAIENIAGSLSEEQFSITNMENIQLSKTHFTGSFSAMFHTNSTSQVDIPQTNRSHSITILVFSSLNNILPIRNAASSDSIQTGTSISGDVIVINTEPRINNISLSYGSKNKSLGNPQCVFWDFKLLNGVGGWDSTGCELKSFKNQSDSSTCECNHTTSFSILMSPFSMDNPALAYITYIGIGISIASLVLCLLIEILIWKSATRNDTSYMRHVSIVNIALSLLIADICFIIGAAIVKTGEKPPVGSCSALTFFIHFFYLALFFWMLISALLLLYRVIMVFSRMSRAKMMAIAFNVGYGAPLIIAVITVASTAGNGGFIHDGNGCWLNWDKTKALLAFVIPALTIVVINLLVLVVIISKILRSGVGATTQPDEKHSIAVIARCVGILTPLFGLTWGFGIGTMVSSDFGIHVVFAFLNSLQGFFILVFGTLLDKKIFEGLLGKMGNLSSTFTVSTNPGPSSVTGHGYTHRFPKRYGYNISEAACSSAAPSSTLESIKFYET